MCKSVNNLFTPMKKLLYSAALLAAVAAAQAGMVVGPWIPIFKGIDRAVGTNFADATIPRLQVANCVRVDLTDPDVQLLPTPPATNHNFETRETLSLTVSNFIKVFGVKVASDANFYNVFPGGSDPNAEGLPSEVYGLQVSRGEVVSVPDSGPDSNGRYVSLLFTTNKEPFLVLTNRPPGTNTAGIYSAISGYYPVLLDGVNVGAAAIANYPDNSIHMPQPRTAFGLSQDRRYLFMMTIDGRQGGYSDGAIDTETATWLSQFGAWDGINMDGGGSTAMYMADSFGNPVRLNHSSYIDARGRERIIGSHLGVLAKPLLGFINDVVVSPADTAATITWTTISNATTQVEYGSTTNFGSFSALDPTPVTNHVVTLSGLIAGSNYFFRVISTVGTAQYTTVGQFKTTNFVIAELIFDVTYSWKYTTNNLDGINWQATNYNDATWMGPGPGLLHVENNTAVAPRNTLLPPGFVVPIPRTYYFRTHFNLAGSLAGVSLVFSNYLDDGAVFYLNGAEIQRAFMPPPPTLITNFTLATGYYCTDTGDATCPYLFGVTGNLLTNLVQGDNVLAVEVHNFNATSPDIVFGSALIAIRPASQPFSISDLAVSPGETNATITWTTSSNSTSRVEYGLTASYGTFTPLDSALVTSHIVRLNGLLPLTNYYFRVISSVGSTQYTASGVFSTVPFLATVLDLTDVWKFTTNNLDGSNWQAPGYDDSVWLGQGPGLLYVEDSFDVFPKSTLLPGVPLSLPRTYYFRTHFTFPEDPTDVTLTFTNYIDDGAVFYLNGAEIQRVRMASPPSVISYEDFTTGAPCSGDATCPDVFTLSGNVIASLVSGDNVLAAEVHQVAATSSDIVFGSSIVYTRPTFPRPKLAISRADNLVTISWNGSGYTLQQAAVLDASSWTNVPGAVTTSPFTTSASGAANFYRLRK
jgi:Phosphodiester glycosidase